MKQGAPLISCNLSNFAADFVAYLLKARTVEAEKQPLIGNARTQQ
jgi:hypothetical protein